MIGLASGAVGLGAGIAKGIVGMVQHNKYANMLEDLTMSMPSGITQAEGILSDMAGRGLAGKETLESKLKGDQESRLSMYREAAGSPSALMDALIKSEADTNSKVLDLGVQDAMAKDKNQSILAQFLGTVKSPTEQRIEQFNIDKKIASGKERMMATKELMNGLEGGIGSALTNYGQGAELTAAMEESAKKWWEF